MSSRRRGAHHRAELLGHLLLADEERRQPVHALEALLVRESVPVLAVHREVELLRQPLLALPQLVELRGSRAAPSGRGQPTPAGPGRRSPRRSQLSSMRELSVVKLPPARRLRRLPIGLTGRVCDRTSLLTGRFARPIRLSDCGRSRVPWYKVRLPWATSSNSRSSWPGRPGPKRSSIQKAQRRRGGRSKTALVLGRRRLHRRRLRDRRAARARPAERQPHGQRVRHLRRHQRRVVRGRPAGRRADARGDVAGRQPPGADAVPATWTWAPCCAPTTPTSPRARC